MARQRGQGRKGRPRRNEAQRILVVTEGTKTEPQYIERLNSHMRSKASTAIVKSVGVGKDPLHVVQKCVSLRDAAVKRKKPYDVGVCLVDVDQHETLQEAAQLADTEAVSLLITNLKFETWLCWHAEDKRSALTSSELDHRAEKLELVLDKSISPHFPISEVGTACEIARQADPDLMAGRQGPNPSSAMPLLIELMQGPLDPGA